MLSNFALRALIAVFSLANLRLRLWQVVVIIAIMGAGFWAISPKTTAPVDPPAEHAETPEISLEDDIQEISPDIDEQDVGLIETPDTPERTVTHIIERGQTLANIRDDYGVSREQVHYAAQALNSEYPARRLRPDQEVSLILFDQKEAGEEIAPILLTMIIKISPTERVVVRRKDQQFVATTEAITLSRKHTVKSGVINASLYQSAIDNHLPLPVLIDMIRLYSFDVDFQRDIQQGDKFAIIYEQLLDHTDSVVAQGDIVAATLVTGGQALPIYRFDNGNGSVNYYDDQGKSVEKALLKTPVEGARLSSGYGMRKHPVLGYNLMHRGVDFAAPTGTPIFAAGDGVVERSNRFGTYGLYVRIRHAGGYKTVYAHMSRIHSRAAQGKRVKQGQVIGYVGATGRVTGPHLHYEVLQNDTQINPSSLKNPPQRQLADENLARFQTERGQFTTMLQTALD
ncbi:MAG: peptidoglycan DD-metalloendopeptidase family protein [Pseudomonadota bacterium]